MGDQIAVKRLEAWLMAHVARWLVQCPDFSLPIVREAFEGATARLKRLEEAPSHDDPALFADPLDALLVR